MKEVELKIELIYMVKSQWLKYFLFTIYSELLFSITLTITLEVPLLLSKTDLIGFWVEIIYVVVLFINDVLFKNQLSKTANTECLI